MEGRDKVEESRLGAEWRPNKWRGASADYKLEKARESR